MALTNVIDGELLTQSLYMARPVIPGALKKKLMVAAIDFGTTYSGYAFQTLDKYKDDPLKIEANNWATRGGVVGMSLKTTSSILFNKEKEFVAFGDEAETQYNTLVQDGKHWDWFFFRRFKMELYKNKELSRGLEIKDNSGQKSMSAMTVFSESIRFLKDHLLAENNKRKTGINESDIQWVLTVPAIWDDAAKQFMREAAIEAYIHTDSLSLSLEPEAASLYCRSLPINKVTTADGQTGLASFASGDRYMILDCGGGTVDITFHEIQISEDDGEATLKELESANGGEWGGIKVDEAFIQFLNDVFGADVMEVVENRYREDYMDFMASFELKKRNAKPDSIGKETMSVPVTMATMYEEMNGKETLENNSKIKNTKYAGKVEFVRDKMKMDASVMNGFFDETCDQICSLASEYFAQLHDYNVDKILMVGGFSESQILQDKVKKAFPTKRVIIPEEAGLAVLKGAVLFGHNPSMITTRVIRFTYGISALTQFQPALDSQDRLVRKGTFRLCKNAFSVHAQKGQAFKPGATVGEIKYLPSETDTTQMQIDIFSSSQSYPRYVDVDTSKKVGELTVPIEQRNEEITVKFVFGETEFDVIAVDKDGKIKKDARFQCLK